MKKSVSNFPDNVIIYVNCKIKFNPQQTVSNLFCSARILFLILFILGSRLSMVTVFSSQVSDGSSMYVEIFILYNVTVAVD